MPPVIDKTICGNCGTCIEICPLDVIHWSKDGHESRGPISGRVLALQRLQARLSQRGDRTSSAAACHAALHHGAGRNN